MTPAISTITGGLLEGGGVLPLPVQVQRTCPLPSLSCPLPNQCNKRRELRKKRFQLEGFEKYKEVNNNIKRCMKKAKENWIGEQSSETVQKI